MFRIIISFIVVIGTAPTLAAGEEEIRRFSIAFDAGLISTYDDGADIWRPGKAVEITGLYPLGNTAFVGGRIGIIHWGYNESKVVPGLIPRGTELVFEQSTGQLQMIEFGPVIRYAREGVLGKRIGLYVQFSGNAVYAKTFALSEIMFVAGGYRPEARKFEINESRYRVAFIISGGFMRPISNSSWIELLPSYRGVLTDSGVLHLAGISLAYRVRI
jgi:hypothetical protein